MPFKRRFGKVEHARKLGASFLDLFGNGRTKAYLLQCCLSAPYCNFNFVPGAKLFGSRLDLEVRHSCKDRVLFVVWHKVDVFAVPLVRCAMVYATVLSGLGGARMVLSIKFSSFVMYSVLFGVEFPCQLWHYSSCVSDDNVERHLCNARVLSTCG